MKGRNHLDPKWRNRWKTRSGLISENKRRLRNLGLPDNFFDPDFWEKEEEARKQELLLLAWFEEQHEAGNLGPNVPWNLVFDSWRKQMEHPLHFAQAGNRPRWVDACNDAASDWRQRERGTRLESWRVYDKKRRERRKLSK